MHADGSHRMRYSALLVRVLQLRQWLRLQFASERADPLAPLKSLSGQSLGGDLLQLLELSTSRLNELACWPQLDDLQRELTRTGGTTDLIATAERAPAQIGALGIDGVFRPTILGISSVPAGYAAVEHFLSALAL